MRQRPPHTGILVRQLRNCSPTNRLLYQFLDLFITLFRSVLASAGNSWCLTA